MVIQMLTHAHTVEKWITGRVLIVHYGANTERREVSLLLDITICYASNIALAHIFVMHLSRPWATRGKGIGENGLRAILGLGLPSKGLCIKDKSCWLGLHSPCTFPCMQAIEKALLPSLLCLESCFLLPICFPLLLRLRSIHPFTTLTLLFLLLSPPSPYDRVVARRRIRGRCSWHHRSCISDQLSQGSGEEVSSPSGCCKNPHDTWVSVKESLTTLAPLPGR